MYICACIKEYSKANVYFLSNDCCATSFYKTAKRKRFVDENLEGISLIVQIGTVIEMFHHVQSSVLRGDMQPKSMRKP